MQLSDAGILEPVVSVRFWNFSARKTYGRTFQRHQSNFAGLDGLARDFLEKEATLQDEEAADLSRSEGSAGVSVAVPGEFPPPPPSPSEPTQPLTRIRAPRWDWPASVLPDEVQSPAAGYSVGGRAGTTLSRSVHQSTRSRTHWEAKRKIASRQSSQAHAAAKRDAEEAFQAENVDIAQRPAKFGFGGRRPKTGPAREDQ